MDGAIGAFARMCSSEKEQGPNPLVDARELSWSELSWSKLSWSELSWSELSWSE